MVKPLTVEQERRLKQAGWRLTFQNAHSQEWEDDSTIPRNCLTLLYGNLGCVIFRGSLEAMAQVVNLLTEKEGADNAASTD